MGDPNRAGNRKAPVMLLLYLRLSRRWPGAIRAELRLSLSNNKTSTSARWVSPNGHGGPNRRQEMLRNAPARVTTLPIHSHT
jgi:hypothetical protein